MYVFFFNEITSSQNKRGGVDWAKLRGSSASHNIDWGFSHLWLNWSGISMIVAWLAAHDARHLGNQRGLLTRVPQFSSSWLFFLSFLFSHGFSVAGFQKGLSQAKKLEAADILSPTLETTQCHFCHILLIKSGHRASPDSMWKWFTYMCESWESWVIGGHFYKLATENTVLRLF